MAILPDGTGNLSARSLGQPLNDEETALRIGLNGLTRQIDVAAIRDRKFVVMAGLGFDAAIMRDAPEGLKKSVGWPPISSRQPSTCAATASMCQSASTATNPIHRRVRRVVVGNIGKLQGGLLLIPDGRADDGCLDDVLIASRNGFDWIRVAARIPRRATIPDRTMERLRGEHIVIEASRTGPRQLDRDVIADGQRMNIQIEPGALAVEGPG